MNFMSVAPHKRQKNRSKEESVHYLPRCASFAKADNHIKAVIARVERLTPALRSVTQHCKSFTLEDILNLLLGIILFER